jgi:hypothetical protein
VVDINQSLESGQLPMGTSAQKRKDLYFIKALNTDKRQKDKCLY